MHIIGGGGGDSPPCSAASVSNYAYHPGAKPGKKHALNSELRLLTYVYGILLRVDHIKVDARITWLNLALQLNTSHKMFSEGKQTHVGMEP